MDAADVDLSAELHRHFGFGSFRPGQEAVIRGVLAGENTVAVMPTGAGKSLCYQLPALLLPGTALVVSPLVALMKDQVDALTARGVPATFINSSIDEGERRRRIESLRRGVYKLVYVAPERFKSQAFLDAVKEVTVSLYAVDEAHCISQWGHDFRPDYTRLGQVRWTLRPPRTLALTATATPEVRQDIVRVLRLKDPKVSVAGFDRPNLFLEVARVSGEHDKLTRIARACKGGGGIVYCATRRDVEKVAAALDDGGIRSLAYHAGMDDDDRHRVQDAFMAREDAVVCATNAFGMGVDKAAIRFVVHHAVPRSVEAYYQEVGRAGRDGAPARALLLFNHADVYLQERLIEGSHPDRAVILAVWDQLRAGGGESRLDEAGLARAVGSSPMEVGAAIKHLERAGHVTRLPRGVVVKEPELSGPSLRVDFQALHLRRRQELNLLRGITDYAYDQGCRRAYLLSYFGDRSASCSGCDVCSGPRDPPTQGELLPPRRKRAARSAKAALGVEVPYDGAVFEALKAMRSTLARAEGLPPYVVFHDRTLRELARSLPSNEVDFLAVPGAGPAKWERYGQHVIGTIAKTKRAAENS